MKAVKPQGSSQSIASMKAVKPQGSSPVATGPPKIQQAVAGGVKPAAKKVVQKPREPKKVTGPNASALPK